MKPKVYLETTVISYLTARPTRDILAHAYRELTRIWWETKRSEYDLYVSKFVHQEIIQGDPEASERRKNIIQGIDNLEASEQAETLTKALLCGPIPQKAARDAAHIAVAAYGGIDYLLTWNCRHISNPILQRDIVLVCESAGVECPIICSPREFLPNDDERSNS